MVARVYADGVARAKIPAHPGRTQRVKQAGRHQALRQACGWVAAKRGAWHPHKREQGGQAAGLGAQAGTAPANGLGVAACAPMALTPQATQLGKTRTIPAQHCKPRWWRTAAAMQPHLRHTRQWHGKADSWRPCSPQPGGAVGGGGHQVGGIHREHAVPHPPLVACGRRRGRAHTSLRPARTSNTGLGRPGGRPCQG